ncbi:MAG TPA: ornithine cyclodeaminase family protein [Gemmatimonadaceae bacterium]|nr:ornithine cyclodeaminase family protein [Gemmatimonadaceae bacterium]
MAIALSETDVRQLVKMPALIDAMERALVAYSRGRVRQPLRTVLAVGDRAFFGSMPAFIEDPPALGTKLLVFNPANAAQELPTHQAAIALLDHVTGELLALMDGRYITEARTAAVSAVATRSLARKDASALALIGSGVQAHSHLQAIAEVRELTSVRVWSPTPAHCRKFAIEHAHAVKAEVVVADTARDAVEPADIIVLATSATTPVVRSEWVQRGAHVCAVGASRPDMREMEGELVARSRLFVDARISALAEAGDIVIPLREGRIDPDHILGEIGEVVDGRVPGRLSDADVTIFKSVGMAVEDVAAAALAFRRATEIGLGRGLIL